MSHPQEPTSEMCSANTDVTWQDGTQEMKGFACWYPQMGGYVGKCVVALNVHSVPEAEQDDEDGFDAFVWHDGEFPFSDERDGRAPTRIHHCSAQQFIRFAQTVQEKGKISRGQRAADPS